MADDDAIIDITGTGNSVTIGRVRMSDGSDLPALTVRLSCRDCGLKDTNTIKQSSSLKITSTPCPKCGSTNTRTQVCG